MDGVGALIKGIPESNLAPSSSEDTVRGWPSENQEVGSHFPHGLFLDFPASVMVKNKCLLFMSCSVHGILFSSPQGLRH